MSMNYPPRGFTLIETMVAITLLAVALIGPFIAVQNSLQSSYVARDQLIASQLAQEGIEYIRGVRDANYFAGRAWMAGISSYTTCYGAAPSGYCHIDPTRGDVHTDSPNHSAMDQYAATSSVPYLRLSTAGLYNQQASGGTVTKFKRLVRVNTLSATQVRITVFVSWVTGNKPYTIIVTDTLHDWI